jgi:amidase
MALKFSTGISTRGQNRLHDGTGHRVRVMRLTCTSGVSGLPQMSIPAGTIDGCPVGLSFIGWAGGDEALLDLACELSHHGGMAA